LINHESEIENDNEIRNRQIREIKLGKEVLPQQETAEKKQKEVRKRKAETEIQYRCVPKTGLE